MAFDYSDKSLQYGWCGFNSKCLQIFNTAKWFVFYMSAANFVQSIVSGGLLGVCASTLEKQFGFTSTQIGWISISYDISSAFIVIIVSYFGTSVHRPRWTAIGEFLVGIGALVFAIPQFMPKRNDVLLIDSTLSESDKLCQNSSLLSTCGTDDIITNRFNVNFMIFILAEVIMGIGQVPIYTLAVTFLDDILSKHNFSLYIGLSNFISCHKTALINYNPLIN